MNHIRPPADTDSGAATAATDGHSFPVTINSAAAAAGGRRPHPSLQPTHSTPTTTMKSNTMISRQPPAAKQLMQQTISSQSTPIATTSAAAVTNPSYCSLHHTPLQLTQTTTIPSTMKQVSPLFESTPLTTSSQLRDHFLRLHRAIHSESGVSGEMNQTILQTTNQRHPLQSHQYQQEPVVNQHLEGLARTIQLPRPQLVPSCVLNSNERGAIAAAIESGRHRIQRLLAHEEKVVPIKVEGEGQSQLKKEGHDQHESFGQEDEVVLMDTTTRSSGVSPTDTAASGWVMDEATRLGEAEIKRMSLAQPRVHDIEPICDPVGAHDQDRRVIECLPDEWEIKATSIRTEWTESNMVEYDQLFIQSFESEHSRLLTLEQRTKGIVADLAQLSQSTTTEKEDEKQLREYDYELKSGGFRLNESTNSIATVLMGVEGNLQVARSGHDDRSAREQQNHMLELQLQHQRQTLATLKLERTTSTKESKSEAKAAPPMPSTPSVLAIPSTKPQVAAVTKITPDSDEEVEELESLSGSSSSSSGGSDSDSSSGSGCEIESEDEAVQSKLATTSTTRSTRVTTPTASRPSSSHIDIDNSPLVAAAPAPSTSKSKSRSKSPAATHSAAFSPASGSATASTTASTSRKRASSKSRDEEEKRMVQPRSSISHATIHHAPPSRELESEEHAIARRHSDPKAQFIMSHPTVREHVKQGRKESESPLYTTEEDEEAPLAASTSSATMREFEQREEDDSEMMDTLPLLAAAAGAGVRGSRRGRGANSSNRRRDGGSGSRNKPPSRASLTLTSTHTSRPSHSELLPITDMTRVAHVPKYRQMEQTSEQRSHEVEMNGGAAVPLVTQAMNRFRQAETVTVSGGRPVGFHPQAPVRPVPFVPASSSSSSEHFIPLVPPS